MSALSQALPFSQPCRLLLGPTTLLVQGVQHPADIPGSLASGDKTGSQTMAQWVSQAASQCPNTIIVMPGYKYALTTLSRSALVSSNSQDARTAANFVAGAAGMTKAIAAKTG